MGGGKALVCCCCEDTQKVAVCPVPEPKFCFCHDVGPVPCRLRRPNNYRLSYYDGSTEYRESDIICPVVQRGHVLKICPLCQPRAAQWCQRRVDPCCGASQDPTRRRVTCTTPQYFRVM